MKKAKKSFIIAQICKLTSLALFSIIAGYSTPANSNEPNQPPSSAERAQSCPSTLSDWNQWRANLVTDLNRPEDLKSKGAILLRCQEDPGQKEIFADARFKACMKNLKNVVTMIANLTDDGLPSSFFEYSGSGIVDHEEVKKFTEPFLDLGKIPKLISDDSPALHERVRPDLQKKGGKTFLQKIGWEHTPKSNQEIADETFKEILDKLPPGARAVSYESASVHRGGIVFILPGKGGRDDVDQFLHLDPAHPNEFIMLTIKKTDSEGKRLSVPEIYPNLYKQKHEFLSAKERAQPEHKVNKLMASPKSEAGRCLVCHRAGAIPLGLKDPKTAKWYSNDGTTPPSSQEGLDWFNQSLLPKTANARPPGQNWDKLGTPSIGEVDPKERTDAFMDACIKSAVPTYPNFAIRRDAIRSAMNCSTSHCHDGKKAGAISFPFFPADFANAEKGAHLKSLIATGVMPPPPDNDLNADEKEALYGCLISEYFGGFKNTKLGGRSTPGTFLKSLTAIPCPQSSSACVQPSPGEALNKVIETQLNAIALPLK